MQEPHDEGLKPEEEAALAALPRERAPSRMLEERTVRALRQRGLLREPRRAPITAAWRAAGIAAALALFAGGTAFGQWLGGRQTAAAIAAVERTDALAAALEVQVAGTAWLDAMAALVDATDGADPEAVRQAREVALAVYRGATEEIQRLQEPESGAAADSVSGVRHVVWF